MAIKIIPHTLHGTVDAMPSKSHAHRVLIAQKIARIQAGEPEEDNRVWISGIPAREIPTFSDDIAATKTCLIQLDKNMPYLECGESGSTLRFMLPVAMVLKDNAEFLGTGRLPNRPISPLKEEMEKHGCTFDMGSGKGTERFKRICTVHGRLTSGEYALPGNISSQFITGLLMALPVVQGDSVLRLTTRLESAGYVSLTLDVLEKFGIKVETGRTPEGFFEYRIPGGQIYRQPQNMVIESDWSNAAFWLAAGALGGDVTVRNLTMESKQWDKEILHALAVMGADVSVESFPEGTSSVTARASRLNGMDADASQIPDLVPVLAVLMSAAPGTSMINNAERLRLKESNRLKTIYLALNELGADISYGGDRLSFTGKRALTGGSVDSFNDHRIVMATTVASCLCSEPVIITGPDAVNKSYPNFFRDFRLLGGEFAEI